MAEVTIEQAMQMALGHQRAGRLGPAESIYRSVLQQVPDHAEALHLLGVILMQHRKLDEAIALLKRALPLRPDLAPLHYNLGTAYIGAHRFKEAIDVLLRSIELAPDYSMAYHNLAAAYIADQQFENSATALERALALKPDGETWNNLGELRKTQGKLTEALACYRKAVELKPDQPEIHSNLLVAMNYVAELSPAEIFAEHRRWAERHEKPLKAQLKPHTNDRSPDRRLKIGYVSPDLHGHPVGYFIEPVILNHDREKFHVTCYSDWRSTDEHSERMKASADAWHVTTNITHASLADRIRQDQIDILVDLAGHTAHNRLMVFARKPAPVQVSYLGYVNTTGLDAIDYVLADRFLNNPAELRSEESIELPRTYTCYQPRIAPIPVGPLPAKTNGFVTFACLNSFTKVSPAAIRAWVRILRRVADSRIVLHAQNIPPRAEVEKLLAGTGVSPDRVEFMPRKPLAEYYAEHNRFDIALDPFPHNGGTTTCDALWMGVPVITFPGASPISRGGQSLLNAANLGELVEDTVEGYIEHAVALAGDLPRLAALRKTLRKRLEASPLMDVGGLVRDLEDAYRAMWRRWCANR